MPKQGAESKTWSRNGALKTFLKLNGNHLSPSPIIFLQHWVKKRKTSKASMVQLYTIILYCITWFCQKKECKKSHDISSRLHFSDAHAQQRLWCRSGSFNQGGGEGTGGLSPLFSHELSVDVPFWVKNLWFPENIQSEALWIGRFTEFCSPEIQVICELCSTYRRIRKNEQFFILNTQSYDPWRA